MPILSSPKNKTRGLLGNWSYDIIDDLMNPDGTFASISNLNNFEAVHKDFAIKWLLEDKEDKLKGAALFTREGGRSGSYYTNRTFEPEWRKTPEDILPANRYVRPARARAARGKHAIVLVHSAQQAYISARR